MCDLNILAVLIFYALVFFKYQALLLAVNQMLIMHVLILSQRLDVMCKVIMVKQFRREGGLVVHSYFTFILYSPIYTYSFVYTFYVYIY